MAVAALLVLAVSCKPQEKHAKYVFYFIGDGMGSTHVAAAEAYLAQERGVIGMDPLCFTQFPVMGEAVSCSANHIITDVKQELRRCSALKIMYGARKGGIQK